VLNMRLSWALLGAFASTTLALNVPQPHRDCTSTDSLEVCIAPPPSPISRTAEDPIAGKTLWSIDQVLAKLQTKLESHDPEGIAHAIIDRAFDAMATAAKPIPEHGATLSRLLVCAIHLSKTPEVIITVIEADKKLLQLGRSKEDGP
jgi:hypothetical protein